MAIMELTACEYAGIILGSIGWIVRLSIEWARWIFKAYEFDFKFKWRMTHTFTFRT
jgi:hypothetical protein